MKSLATDCQRSARASGAWHGGRIRASPRRALALRASKSEYEAIKDAVVTQAASGQSVPLSSLWLVCRQEGGWEAKGHNVGCMG